MIGRLKDLNSSIKKRLTFNRDEMVDSSNEGIESQRENIVEEPVNNDIDIRSISQDDDREEADRQSVRRKLREIQNQTKRISFGQAFKNARAAGKKTFWWRGKEYNTKLKGEVNTEKKSVNNKTTSNRTTSNRTSSNRAINTNNSTSNKQNNTTASTTSKKTVTNAKSASTNHRNVETAKKGTSNFENNLNKYGSKNKFDFRQNYQTPKKETPKRNVRLSDEELMRELKRRNEKRIRSQKNNPVYKSKGTKLENVLGM